MLLQIRKSFFLDQKNAGEEEQAVSLVIGR
jgi:hypothetical protein